MSEPSDFLLEIFLQPGDFYFGDRETRIRTLLGSCVAITMWHPRLHIGGMCHYMVPRRGESGTGEPDGRYADEAMHLFLKEIQRSGTRPRDYHVKLFGGGNMFPETYKQEQEMIGSKNALAGLELLEAHGFAIKAQSLGGVGHRNVIFDVWSGDVWVKRH